MKCDFCGGQTDPTEDMKHAHKGCWQQYQQDRADDHMMTEAYENGEI
jgi:hypothetical protein